MFSDFCQMLVLFCISSQNIELSLLIINQIDRIIQFWAVIPLSLVRFCDLEILNYISMDTISQVIY